MYQTILIPVTLGHAGAFPRQVDVAQHLLAPGGRLVAVSVMEGFPTFAAEYMIVHLDPAELRQAAQLALDEILAPYPDIESKLLAGKPGVVLTQLAMDIDADLIITGASRPGSNGYALGSTASRIVRRAPCSVMVIR